MTTPNTLGDAFYQASDTGRWLIKPDHPQEGAARRIVSAVGGQYEHNLSALDWAYKAVANILNAIEYDWPWPNPDDTISDIADALTDIYSNDLRRWYCEFPAVFEHHEQEAIDDGMLDGCRHVIETLQHVQCLAYEQAVRAVADELRAIEAEEEEFNDVTLCPECGNVFDNEDEYCPECEEAE